MRKVRFNKWVPAEYKDRSLVPGTNCWEKDFPNEGLFHEWGSQSTEFSAGAVTDTIAIVETPDGLVHSVLPFNLKFETE